MPTSGAGETIKSFNGNLLSPYRSTKLNKSGVSGTTLGGVLLDEEYALSASEDGGNQVITLPIPADPDESPVNKSSPASRKLAQAIIDNLTNEHTTDNIKRILIKRHSPNPQSREEEDGLESPDEEETKLKEALENRIKELESRLMDINN